VRLSPSFQAEGDAFYAKCGFEAPLAAASDGGSGNYLRRIATS